MKKQKISRRLSKKLRNVFSSIVNRCSSPKSISYPIYGGRGIKCLWVNADEFLADMYPSYKEGLTIERINNDGNYSKENCRWATRTEQANNRRTSRFLTFDGQTKTIAQWGEKTGISQTLILGRINSGWSIERALKTPDKTRTIPIEEAVINSFEGKDMWLTSDEILGRLRNFKNIAYLRKRLKKMEQVGTLERKYHVIPGAKGVGFYKYKLL